MHHIAKLLAEFCSPARTRGVRAYVGIGLSLK
jgi:hypothetical protein